MGAPPRGPGRSSGPAGGGCEEPAPAPGSPRPLLAQGRSTGAVPVSAAALSPGSHWRPCKSPCSLSPPGPWKRATVVPWPPLVQRRGWRWRGAGWGKGGCSPVLPKVQGEGVPSGPQDVAHSLWVQALGRGQGGVQGEALPGHAHLKPGGVVGLGLYPGLGQAGSSTQGWASGLQERTMPLPGHVWEGDPGPERGRGGRAALPASAD